MILLYGGGEVASGILKKRNHNIISIIFNIRIDLSLILK